MLDMLDKAHNVRPLCGNNAAHAAEHLQLPRPIPLADDNEMLAL